MKEIQIIHLYAKEMNIYGDNGNVLVLKKRLMWRGIPAQVHSVGVGDKLPNDAHLIIGGGGQDAGQLVVADDLQAKASDLKALAKLNTPMLMICGMYQMFGHYFKTSDGQKISGIGIIDAYTEATEQRIIGNVVCKSAYGNLVGYENHSGRTMLGAGVKPLGSVKKAQGNNGIDKQEGAVVDSVYGSYLHGPVLAKSPEFADHLLLLALTRAGIEQQLEAIDDRQERQAAKIAAKRPR